ncbi:hypothetical protein AC578_4422 [Pseudocercospora eumusae]|uniref:Uncharacterized protein n=1 Tax=Pseudocercospora eumusae TaxID=321146 RepID=A0A139HEY7_9PEZI|nr:hypothetical protein AC578_4422 [Pseudocercospora eumusae]
MGLKYFPDIDEPQMPRTPRRSRFAYLADMDDEPACAPKQKTSKRSTKSSKSDKPGDKSTKARSIIVSTIEMAKKGLRRLKPTQSDHRSCAPRLGNDCERGGHSTSTEILQDQSRRCSHECSPPGGELKRSHAIRLRPSTAHLKKSRASLNQKLAEEWEYQYLRRQTILKVWP